jgi:ERCC4-type nuclease
VFAGITPDLETEDGAWRSPYLFDAVPADVGAGGGVWRVRTERLTLASGDYSLDGYASQVAVERKSLADLFGTLGQGRERFVRELERLDQMSFAAVVVEREWSDIFTDPPRHSRLAPRTVYRSVLAWQQRFPRVHWWMCAGREMAEVTTFRILERFLKELADKNFRKPRA